MAKHRDNKSNRIGELSQRDELKEIIRWLCHEYGYKPKPPKPIEEEKIEPIKYEELTLKIF
jgi:hypothetical protein